MWLLCVLTFFSATISAFGQDADSSHPQKTIQASRINSMPIRLDGILDDQIWQTAAIATDFRQRDPDDGEPATEKTAFQIAYDDKAMYVGVMCYDSEPDKIVAPLARRDRTPPTDQITLNLDSHHDHKTRFYFSVGPSGWISDGVLLKDGWNDSTWDGVWEAKAVILNNGWSVEYRIPYHVLRFAEEESYTWGVNIERRVLRKNEVSRWIYIPKGESGFNSRFGHLEGIENITPPKHFEMLPFAVARPSFVPKDDSHPTGRDFFSTGGVDFRYGLTSNISLNATVNPDFGQVEGDPSVLNLGVFETFFSERRPFFLEGASIFQYSGPGIVAIRSPARLLHSRRIGRRPNRFSKPKGTKYISRPERTTILSAMKLSGKTSRGTSFGILEAVTRREFATIEETFTDPVTGSKRAERRRHLIEPTTNYMVARVQQDLWASSHVGAFASAVNGKGFKPAYVGSVDGELNWKDRTYKIFTRFTGSRTERDDKRKEGFEASAYFSKNGGTFGGQAYIDTQSPGFDVNDLGFVNRSNHAQFGGHIYASIRNPWLLARESGFNINGWVMRNYQGLTLRKGLNFNNWHELKNYWWFNFGVSIEPETSNDVRTRGGPPIKKPGFLDFWTGFGTDSRKAVRVSFFINGKRDEGGRTFSKSFDGSIRYRPSPRLVFTISPEYRTNRDFAQWIENVDDDDDGEDDHFVFGELRNRTWDITTRVNLAFSPNASLQVYLQNFVAVGDYLQVKELARPSSYEFTPYTGLDENPDFNRRSLVSNVVFSWEYRPGSVLFLVWSQDRDESFDNDDPTFRPWSSTWDTFSDQGDNIFLVKLNYWFGL